MSISKAARAARRGWAQRGDDLIDFIVTVEVDSPKFSGGKQVGVRTTKRDFIVPARPNTRNAEILWLIKERRGRDDLLKREQYAVDFMFVDGTRVTIAEGPSTRGRKVKLR